MPSSWKRKFRETPRYSISTQMLNTQSDPEEIFELLEQVGVGSYGNVYKGRRKTTNENYAIKIIKLEPGEQLDSIIQEVTFLKSWTHENLVSYQGCFLKRGCKENNMFGSSWNFAPVVLSNALELSKSL